MNIFQQVFANANSNKQTLTNNPVAQPSDCMQTQIQTKSKTESNSSRPLVKSSLSQPEKVTFDLKNILNTQNSKKEVQILNEKRSSQISTNSTSKKKKDIQNDLYLMNKLEAVKKKVSDMELRLKQKQIDLKNIKEKNENLRFQKQEKEIYIEKINAATDELNKKIIQMQDDFDQEDEERNKYWEFRYMELKFQIETLKEESAQ